MTALSKLVATMGLAMSTAYAQGGVQLSEADIVQITESLIGRVAADSVMMNGLPNSEYASTDVSFALRKLRSTSRIPMAEIERSRVKVPPRLRDATFSEFFDCPTAVTNSFCRMKRTGHFVSIFDVKPGDAGGTIVVWVSVGSKSGANAAHFRAVTRGYTYRRSLLGVWEYAGASEYFAS